MKLKKGDAQNLIEKIGDKLLTWLDETSPNGFAGFIRINPEGSWVVYDCDGEELRMGRNVCELSDEIGLVDVITGEEMSEDIITVNGEKYAKVEDD